MKKLTLTEACQLAAANELGEKARAKLVEHTQQFPKALLELEIARGNMAFLNALPKAKLTSEQRKQIASKIKVGIQKKLNARKHEEQAKRRSKLIYRALAGVAGIAAALVITGTIFYFQGQEEYRRQQLAKENEAYQVARATQVLDSYVVDNDPTELERDLHEMQHSIQSFSDGAVANNNASNDVSRLVNELDVTPEDEQDFAPSL